MACELANAENRRCQMVLVADDRALPPTKGVTGARGVAGVIWVHKIAGAAAASGLGLNDVANLARDAAERIGTLGVALDAVTIPGAKEVNDRLSGGEMIEIGMGIHGEAGMRQSPLESANELAKVMVKTVAEYGCNTDDVGDEKNKVGSAIVPTFRSGDELAVMVNNLGGTSNFEMSILANSVVKILEDNTEEFGNCTVSRLYVGAFMTSFGMNGASVSIMSLTSAPIQFTSLLDMETNAPAWSRADVWRVIEGPRPSTKEVPEVVDESFSASSKQSYENIKLGVDLKDFSEMARSSIAAACQALIDAEPQLTRYDTIVGDGDCGLTMERGAREILSRLQSSKEPGNTEKNTLCTAHPIPMFENLADAVSSSMGGTSGILLELMFRKMSTFCNTVETVDSKSMRDAFGEGVRAISFYGGASVGSRTMLDALVPALEEFQRFSNGNYGDSESPDVGCWDKVVEAATRGAEDTAAMKSASAGRSNYLGEEVLDGTPDPGAVAVSVVLKAVWDALR